MKRCFTIVLALVFVFLLTACSSNEKKNTGGSIIGRISDDLNTSVWDGTIAASFSKGSGTYEDPYIIKSASELAFVAQSCSEGHNFSGQYIELGCNIDLNGREWSPIGIYSSQFLYIHFLQ